MPTKPAFLARVSTLELALAFSFALHALLLSLHFSFPDAARKLQNQALDVILVNSRSAQKPSDAQALAQAHLDGGGNTDQNRRAKTPLPPTQQHQSGEQLEHMQRRVQELERRQRELLARTSQLKTQLETKAAEPQPSPGTGFDLAEAARAMARLEGEIGKNTEEYNKRPRKKFIGARTSEYRFAQYIEDWRQKVERVGTLNYPEAARGKLYGTLVLTVTLNRDGEVVLVSIDRSSGHKILDDAARRIVHMAAPYAPFPPAIRADTDQLVITRAWTFTRSDSLETQ